ncbi:MAG: sigma 54-interacting transcriptional regulator [Candidatus Acidiferrales bacterium]|jgi:two-component system response regulator AtoC
MKKKELLISSEPFFATTCDYSFFVFWRLGCLFLGCRCSSREKDMAGNSSKQGPSQADTYALPPDDIIFGCTSAMLTIRHQLEKVCSANIPILIQGGGGSGKEILARWIHRRSSRNSGPFIKLNFAAIPGSLIESELFGYEAGAFTGANSPRIGRVEMAQGGTLLLDQLTDLDSSFQAKLLQLLQDGRFTRLGDQEERRLEARIICANCGRLEEAVKSGHFRQDLYYRVNVFEVVLPPLSARRDDIPAIASYMLGQLSLRFQREAPKLEESKLRLLQNRDWPGNIREMENWLSRYVLLGDEELPRENPSVKLQASIAKAGAEEGTIPLKRIVRQAGKALSRELILGALQANRWNRRKAARDLKISYRTLLYEIREVGLPSKRVQKQAIQSAAPLSATPVSTD